MAQCVRAPGTSCGWAAAPAVRRPRAALAVRAAAYGDSQNNAASRRQTLLAGGALLGGLVLPGGAGAGATEVATPPATDSIYDLSAFMYGEEVSLERYRGKVGAAHRCSRPSSCPCISPALPPLAWHVPACSFTPLPAAPLGRLMTCSSLPVCAAGADGGERRQRMTPAGELQQRRLLPLLS